MRANERVWTSASIVGEFGDHTVAESELSWIRLRPSLVTASAFMACVGQGSFCAALGLDDSAKTVADSLSEQFAQCSRLEGILAAIDQQPAKVIDAIETAHATLSSTCVGGYVLLPINRRFAASLLVCQRLTEDNGVGPAGSTESAERTGASASIAAAGGLHDGHVSMTATVSNGPAGVTPLTPAEYVESGRTARPQDGIGAGLAPAGSPTGGRWHVAIISSDAESLVYHEGMKAGPRLQQRRRATVILHGVPSERLIERGFLASLLVGQRKLTVSQTGMKTPHTLYESLLPTLAGERLLSAQARIPSDARGPMIQADISNTSQYRCTIAASLYVSFRMGLGSTMRGKLRLAFRSAFLRQCVRQLRVVAQLPPLTATAQDEDAAKAAAAMLADAAAINRRSESDQGKVIGAASGAGALESKAADPGDEDVDVDTHDLLLEDHEETTPLDTSDVGISMGHPNQRGQSRGLEPWADDTAREHEQEGQLLERISQECAEGLKASDGAGDSEAWLRERRLPGIREFEVKLLGTAVASTARMCLRLLRVNAIGSNSAGFIEQLIIDVRRLIGVLDIEDAMHLTDAEAKALGPAVEAWHAGKASRQGPPLIETGGPTLAPARGFRGLEHLMDERDTSVFEGQNMTSMQENFVDLALGPRPGYRADGRVDFRGDIHDISAVLQQAVLGADRLMSRGTSYHGRLIAAELAALIEDVFLNRLPVPWTWNEARDATDDALRRDGQDNTIDQWLAAHRRELLSTDPDIRRGANMEFRQLEEMALQAYTEAARDGLCDPWQPPCCNQQILHDVQVQLRYLMDAYTAARANADHLVAEAGTCLVTGALVLACSNALLHIAGMDGDASNGTLLLNHGMEGDKETQMKLGGRMGLGGPRHYITFASLTPGFTSLAGLTAGACLANPAAIAARPLIDECFKAYKGVGARPLFNFFGALKFDPKLTCWVMNDDRVEWEILNWMVRPHSHGGSTFDFFDRDLPRTYRRQQIQTGQSRGIATRAASGSSGDDPPNESVTATERVIAGLAFDWESYGEIGFHNILTLPCMAAQLCQYAHSAGGGSQFFPPVDFRLVPNVRLLQRASIHATVVGLSFAPDQSRGGTVTTIAPNMTSADVHSMLESPLRFLQQTNSTGPWTDEWIDANARERARQRDGRSIIERIGGMLGFADDTTARQHNSRDPLRIVRPTGFEAYCAWRWTHSEDVVVRSPKMPHIGGSLSSQDVEYILCLMCVPYIRLPLILRFIARRGASAICSSSIVRGLIENLLFQPREYFDPKIASARGGMMYSSARQAAADSRQAQRRGVILAAASSAFAVSAAARPSSSGISSGRVQQESSPHVLGSEEVQNVPLISTQERAALGTREGILMNELKHAPAGIVSPLLELAHEIDGLCTADTATSTLPVLMYMIQNISRVEGVIVLSLDIALAWVKSKNLNPDILRDARCVLPDGTRPAEAIKALERIRLWTMGAARRKLLLLLDRNMKIMFGVAAGEEEDVQNDIAAGTAPGGDASAAPSSYDDNPETGFIDGYDDDEDYDDDYDENCDYDSMHGHYDENGNSYNIGTPSTSGMRAMHTGRSRQHQQLSEDVQQHQQQQQQRGRLAALGRDTGSSAAPAAPKPSKSTDTPAKPKLSAAARQNHADTIAEIRVHLAVIVQHLPARKLSMVDLTHVVASVASVRTRASYYQGDNMRGDMTGHIPGGATQMDQSHGQSQNPNNSNNWARRSMLATHDPAGYHTSIHSSSISKLQLFKGLAGSLPFEMLQKHRELICQRAQEASAGERSQMCEQLTSAALLQPAAPEPLWMPETSARFVCKHRIDSPHPYRFFEDMMVTVRSPGAAYLVIKFDAKTSLAPGDRIHFFRDETASAVWGEVGGYTGTNMPGYGNNHNWPGLGNTPPLVIPTDRCVIRLRSNQQASIQVGMQAQWGFGIDVEAPVCGAAALRLAQTLRRRVAPDHEEEAMSSSIGASESKANDVASLTAGGSTSENTQQETEDAENSYRSRLAAELVAASEIALSRSSNDERLAMQLLDDQSAVIRAEARRAISDAGTGLSQIGGTYVDGSGSTQVNLQTGELRMRGSSVSKVPAEVENSAPIQMLKTRVPGLASAMHTMLGALIKETENMRQYTFRYRNHVYTVTLWKTPALGHGSTQPNPSGSAPHPAAMRPPLLLPSPLRREVSRGRNRGGNFGAGQSGQNSMVHEHVRPQGYAPAGDDNCATVPVTAFGMPVVRGGVAYYRKQRFTSEYDPKLCGWLGRLFDLRLNARDYLNEVPVPNEKLAAMFGIEPNRFLRAWMSDGLPEAIAGASLPQDVDVSSVVAVSKQQEVLDGRIIMFGNVSQGKNGLPHDTPENLIDGFWYDIEVSSLPYRRVRVFKLEEVARHYKRVLCFESDCTRGVSSLDPSASWLRRRVMFAQECRHRSATQALNMVASPPYTTWKQHGMAIHSGSFYGGATVKREIVGLAGQAALLSAATVRPILREEMDSNGDETGVKASRGQSVPTIPESLDAPEAESKLRKASAPAELLLPVGVIEQACQKATIASVERMVGAEDLIEPKYLIGSLPTALIQQYTFFRVRDAIDLTEQQVLPSLPEVEKDQTELDQSSSAGIYGGDSSAAQAATLAAQARAKGIGLLDQAAQCFASMPQKVTLVGYPTGMAPQHVRHSIAIVELVPRPVAISEPPTAAAHLVDSSNQGRVPKNCQSRDVPSAAALLDDPTPEELMHNYYSFDVEASVRRFQLAEFVKYWASTRLGAAPASYGERVECEFLIASHHSADSSAMGRLARCLGRIERPGFVLYWSRGAANRGAGHAIPVSHVELPRLELTFDVQQAAITSLALKRTKKDEVTCEEKVPWQISCRELSGQTLSNHRPRQIGGVLRHLPFSIVLCNETGKVSILSPVCSSLVHSIDRMPLMTAREAVMADVERSPRKVQLTEMHHSLQYVVSPNAAAAAFMVQNALLAGDIRAAHEFIQQCEVDDVQTYDDNQAIRSVLTDDSLSMNTHPDVIAAMLRLERFSAIQSDEMVTSITNSGGNVDMHVALPGIADSTQTEYITGTRHTAVSLTEFRLELYYECFDELSQHARLTIDEELDLHKSGKYPVMGQGRPVLLQAIRQRRWQLADKATRAEIAWTSHRSPEELTLVPYSASFYLGHGALLQRSETVIKLHLPGAKRVTANVVPGTCAMVATFLDGEMTQPVVSTKVSLGIATQGSSSDPGWGNTAIVGQQVTVTGDQIAVVVRSDPQIQILTPLQSGYAEGGKFYAASCIPVAPVQVSLSGGSAGRSQPALVWLAQGKATVEHVALESTRRDLAVQIDQSYAAARACEPGVVPEVESIATVDESLDRGNVAQLEESDALFQSGILGVRDAAQPRSLFLYEPVHQMDGGVELEKQSFHKYEHLLKAALQRHLDPGLYRRIHMNNNGEPSDTQQKIRSGNLLSVSAYLTGKLRDYVPSKHTDKAGCGRAMHAIVDPSKDDEIAAFFGAIDLSWLRKCSDTSGVAAPGSLGAAGELPMSEEECMIDSMDDSKMDVLQPLGRSPGAEDFKIPLTLLRAFMFRFQTSHTGKFANPRDATIACIGIALMRAAERKASGDVSVASRGLKLSGWQGMGLPFTEIPGVATLINTFVLTSAPPSILHAAAIVQDMLRAPLADRLEELTIVGQELQLPEVQGRKISKWDLRLFGACRNLSLHALDYFFSGDVSEEVPKEVPLVPPRQPLAALDVDVALAQEPLQRPFAMDSLRNAEKVSLRSGDSTVIATDDSSEFAASIGDVKDRLLDSRGSLGLHGKALLSGILGADATQNQDLTGMADALIVQVHAPGNTSHINGQFSRSVPFDVSKMPELQSAVGQSMLARFKADANRSADSNLAAMQQLVRCADDAVCVAANTLIQRAKDISKAVAELGGTGAPDDGGASFQEAARDLALAREGLLRLEARLQMISSNDSRSSSDEVVQLLMQCNKPQFGLSSSTNSEENVETDVAAARSPDILNTMLRLQHESFDRAPANYSRLVSTLLTNSRRIVSRQWNPSLSAASVNSVVEAVSVLTLVALRGEQARQCQEAVRGVRAQLEGIISDCLLHRVTAELPQIVEEAFVAESGWTDPDLNEIVSPPALEVRRALQEVGSAGARVVSLTAVKSDYTAEEISSLPFNASSGLRKMRTWVRVFIAYGGASLPMSSAANASDLRQTGEDNSSYRLAQANRRLQVSSMLALSAPGDWGDLLVAAGSSSVTPAAMEPTVLDGSAIQDTHGRLVLIQSPRIAPERLRAACAGGASSSAIVQKWLDSACSTLGGDVRVMRAKSVAAASHISSKRHYMRSAGSNVWIFDPRYLAMELVTGFVLRGRQVEMIGAFMESALGAQSPHRVIQAIMGLGKSTVISPALAIALSDGKSLVTTVVPASLLDMSRRMLRTVVAAPFFNRMVITFEFERFVIPKLQSTGPPSRRYSREVEDLVIEEERNFAGSIRRHRRDVAIPGESGLRDQVRARDHVVDAPFDDRDTFNAVKTSLYRVSVVNSIAGNRSRLTSYHDRLWRLWERLEMARRRGMIVIATPEAVKSCMLQFIDMMQDLRSAPPHAFLEQAAVMATSSDLATDLNNETLRLMATEACAEALRQILNLWSSDNNGLVLCDEVDLIVQPLKSELNFPLNRKFPLFLSPERWLMPIWILSGLLACCSPETLAEGGDPPAVPPLSSQYTEQLSGQPTSGDESDLHERTVAAARIYLPVGSLGAGADGDSPEEHPVLQGPSDSRVSASALLLQMREALRDGVRQLALQTTPHVVLLDKQFYQRTLLPQLARWSLLWILEQESVGNDWCTKDQTQQGVEDPAEGTSGSGKAAAPADEESSSEDELPSSVSRDSISSARAGERQRKQRERAVLKNQQKAAAAALKKAQQQERNASKMDTTVIRAALKYIAGEAGSRSRESELLMAKSSDKTIRLLNLNRDLLNLYIPHALSKVDRVSYGLLQQGDPGFMELDSRGKPTPRAVLAVPFLGKEQPSPTSEYSHQDVLICLSYLAYRYEGLRYEDCTRVVNSLRNQMAREQGRPDERPSSRQFMSWLEQARSAESARMEFRRQQRIRAAESDALGSVVSAKMSSSGTDEGDHGSLEVSDLVRQASSATVDDDDAALLPAPALLRMPSLGLGGGDEGAVSLRRRGSDAGEFDIAVRGIAGGPSGGGSRAQKGKKRSLDVLIGSEQDSWNRGGNRSRVAGVLPLPLIDMSNEVQMMAIHEVLCDSPAIISEFLRKHVFPAVMHHQRTKIMATGVDIVGEQLFARRLGFSGTPNDLLPRGMQCEYEPGSEAKILRTLTNPDIIGVFEASLEDWSVQSLLTSIAKADPPYNAVIDTGALITGMSNEQAARFVLKRLRPRFKGCVYIDNEGRQMAVMRGSGRTIPLQDCGLAPTSRFVIFDHAHTTGQDIKQGLDARAVVTLSNDMTLRDMAQGCYRMRGLGQGQKLSIAIIPEVLSRVQDVSNQGFLPRDVVAWLVTKSIRSEHMQHLSLCQLRLSNIWRQKALRTLRSEPSPGLLAEREVYLPCYDARLAIQSTQERGGTAAATTPLSADDGNVFHRKEDQEEVGRRVRAAVLARMLGTSNPGEEALQACRESMMKAFQEGSHRPGTVAGESTIQPPARAMLALAILEMLSDPSSPDAPGAAATGGTVAARPNQLVTSQSRSVDHRSFGMLSNGFVGQHWHLLPFFPLLDCPGLRPPAAFLLCQERMFQGALMRPLVTRFADARALEALPAPDATVYNDLMYGQSSASGSSSAGGRRRFRAPQQGYSRNRVELSRYDLKRSDVLIGVEPRQQRLSRCVEAFLDPMEFDVPATIEPPVGFAQKLERMLHQWMDIVGDDVHMRGYASEALRDARTAARDVILLAVADAQSSRDSSLQRRLVAERARQREEAVAKASSEGAGASESKSSEADDAALGGGTKGAAGPEDTESNDDMDGVVGENAAVEYAAARIVGFDGELVSQQEVTQEREQEKQQEKEQEVLQELVTAPRDRDACRFPRQWQIGALAQPMEYDQRQQESLDDVGTAARVAAAAAFSSSPLLQEALVAEGRLAEFAKVRLWEEPPSVEMPHNFLLSYNHTPPTSLAYEEPMWPLKNVAIVLKWVPPPVRGGGHPPKEAVRGPGFAGGVSTVNLEEVAAIRRAIHSRSPYLVDARDILLGRVRPAHDPGIKRASVELVDTDGVSVDQLYLDDTLHLPSTAQELVGSASALDSTLSPSEGVSAVHVGGAASGAGSGDTWSQVGAADALVTADRIDAANIPLQAARFFNMDTVFTDSELAHLLAALGASPIEQRLRLYTNLVLKRRREVTGWDETPLATVLTDRLQVRFLKLRAIAAQIRTGLIKRFGSVKAGLSQIRWGTTGEHASPSELIAALPSLGITAMASDVAALIDSSATDGAGLVGRHMLQQALEPPTRAQTLLELSQKADHNSDRSARRVERYLGVLASVLKSRKTAYDRAEDQAQRALESLQKKRLDDMAQQQRQLASSGDSSSLGIATMERQQTYSVADILHQEARSLEDIGDIVVTSGGSAIIRADGTVSAPTARASVVTVQPRAIALQWQTGVFASEFVLCRTSEDLFGALPDSSVPARPEDDLVVEDKPVANSKGSMIDGLRRRVIAQKKLEAEQSTTDVVADPNLDVDLEAVLDLPAVFIGICITSFKGSVRSANGFGTHPDTVALGDDGFIWANAQRCGAPVCRPLRLSDTVGMCVDTDKGRLVFSLNGHPVVAVGGAPAAVSRADEAVAEVFPPLVDAPGFIGVAPASMAMTSTTTLLQNLHGVNIGVSLDFRGVTGINLGQQSFTFKPAIASSGSIQRLVDLQREVQLVQRAGLRAGRPIPVEGLSGGNQVEIKPDGTIFRNDVSDILQGRQGDPSNTKLMHNAVCIPTIGVSRGRWYFEVEVLDYDKVSGFKPEDARKVHAAAAHAKMYALESMKGALGLSGDRASNTLAKAALTSDITIGFMPVAEATSASVSQSRFSTYSCERTANLLCGLRSSPVYGKRVCDNRRHAIKGEPAFNPSLATEWLSLKTYRHGRDVSGFSTLAQVCRARVEPFCSELVQWYESTGASRRLAKLEAFAELNEESHADAAHRPDPEIVELELDQHLQNASDVSRNIIQALDEDAGPEPVSSSAQSALPSAAGGGSATPDVPEPAAHVPDEAADFTTVSPQYSADDYVDHPAQIGEDGEPVPFGKQFGSDWSRPGNVIGVAVDLFENTVSYSLNGSFAGPWGVAHEKVDASGGMSFAAAVGLGHAIRVNLGQTRFKHRPPAGKQGYRSLGSWVLQRSPVLQRALAEAQMKFAQSGEMSMATIVDGADEDAFAAHIPAGADLALAARAFQVHDDAAGPASGAGSDSAGTAAVMSLDAPPALMRGPSTAYATDGEPQAPEEMQLRVPIQVIRSFSAEAIGSPLVVTLQTESDYLEELKKFILAKRKPSMFSDPFADLKAESGGHSTRVLAATVDVCISPRIPGFAIGIPTLREFKAFFPEATDDMSEGDTATRLRQIRPVIAYEIEIIPTGLRSLPGLQVAWIDGEYFPPPSMQTTTFGTDEHSWVFDVDAGGQMRHGNAYFGMVRSFDFTKMANKLECKRLFVRTVVDTLTGTVHFAIHNFGAGMLDINAHWETMRVSIPEGTRRLRPAIRLPQNNTFRMRMGGPAEPLHYSYKASEHPAREAGVPAISVYDATVAQLRRRQELRVRLARARGDEGEALRLEQGGARLEGGSSDRSTGADGCVVS